MNVTIRLGTGLVESTGKPRLQLALAENATVADLLAYLREQHPSLAPKLNSAVPMISGRHAPPSQPLVGGQEVALLLPVAGG